MEQSMGKFDLGKTVITAGGYAELDQSHVLQSLTRHSNGDWGDICQEDKTLNDESLVTSGRLFSAYCSPDGTKYWIITEWDRSYTTVLLPDEY